MTGLCRVLRDRKAAAALEADLAHLGIDLCDLWRRRLTLRRVAVLVRHLTAHESALITYLNDGVPMLSMNDLLLMQVWEATTGERHPARPEESPAKADDPARLRKMAAARARKRERERRIAAGEIA